MYQPAICPVSIPGVVLYLFEAIGTYDVAIPQWNEQMLEPLHAVYHRTALLSYLESHTSLSFGTMIQTLHAHYVPVDDLRALYPDLRTFTNINKLEELERINISSKMGPGGSSPKV